MLLQKAFFGEFYHCWIAFQRIVPLLCSRALRKLNVSTIFEIDFSGGINELSYAALDAHVLLLCKFRWSRKMVADCRQKICGESYRKIQLDNMLLLYPPSVMLLRITKHLKRYVLGAIFIFSTDVACFLKSCNLQRSLAQYRFME